MTPKQQERLRRLRAKAKSTSYPAERDAFHRKAAELEERYDPFRYERVERSAMYEEVALMFDGIEGMARDAQWCREQAAACRIWPRCR